MGYGGFSEPEVPAHGAFASVPVNGKTLIVIKRDGSVRAFKSESIPAAPEVPMEPLVTSEGTYYWDTEGKRVFVKHPTIESDVTITLPEKGVKPRPLKGTHPFLTGIQRAIMGTKLLGQSAHPPCRQGCIECVEKHLGAASVLLSEVRDGYESHRLRAIGHLHEAEDESQPWPALHEAIRAARKAYQSEEIAPDFDKLYELVAETRKSSLGAVKENGSFCKKILAEELEMARRTGRTVFERLPIAIARERKRARELQEEANRTRRFGNIQKADTLDAIAAKHREAVSCLQAWFEGHARG